MQRSQSRSLLQGEEPGEGDDTNELAICGDCCTYRIIRSLYTLPQTCFNQIVDYMSNGDSVDGNTVHCP